MSSRQNIKPRIYIEKIITLYVEEHFSQLYTTFLHLNRLSFRNKHLHYRQKQTSWRIPVFTVAGDLLVFGTTRGRTSSSFRACQPLYFMQGRVLACIWHALVELSGNLIAQKIDIFQWITSNLLNWLQCNINI